ncbi:HWE histidine kinase domain-containing protein [Caulobacter sp. 73W]|uniref:histidine kinase n=1 Tax=Caulobacter sp. 73W TaxID=3161137 RepID=A0AB39KYQ1_9CAUL
MRMVLAPLVSGVPFLTFFPSLLIATVFLGWRWGVVVLVGSALTANYMFQPPLMAFSFGTQEAVSTACFAIFGALEISVADALRRSVIELEDRTEREAHLNVELQHRVNNTLTIVQGLARQTARHSDTSKTFYEAFSDRLLAVSQANQILSSQGWSITALPDLAQAALKPFTTSGRIVVSGPSCQLPAKSSVPLALALHELATNAVKYGALSIPSGGVRLSWSVEADQCRLIWREEDGPSVKPPTRRGLGSKLLRAQAGLEAVSLEFLPGGVVCRVAIDGAKLTATTGLSAHGA